MIFLFDLVSLLKTLIVFFFFERVHFKPINFNSLTIVKISFTKGMFFISELLDKIVAAKIGRVAFLEPDILILPFNFFFPLIMSLCILRLNFW